MTRSLQDPTSDSSGLAAHRALLRVLCLALTARVVVELPARDEETTAMLARIVGSRGGRVISVGEPDTLTLLDWRLSADGLRDVADLVSMDGIDGLRKSFGADVDAVFISPSALAEDTFLPLLSAVASGLRPGAVLFSTSTVTWYSAYVRDPANGLRTSLSALGAISLSTGAGRA